MDDKDHIIQKLEDKVRLLTEELDVLKRLLGLNSTTSSKPPSSDGLRKKPTPKSLRQKGVKPSGGQKGHKGATLQQVAHPDAVETHAPATCAQCAQSLEEVREELVTQRQVFDIPLPRMEVTAHRVVQKTCTCGHINVGSFPEHVTAPVQYGPRVHGLVVYMMNQQFVPEDRLQMLLSDVFDANLATATLVSMNTKFAAKVAPHQEAVLAQIKIYPVKPMDETGFRIRGKTQWLHVLSTPTLTHYRVAEKRKDLEPMTGMTGTAVHDHWKPYFQLKGVDHGLCNAHHLRELQALMEIEKEGWAKKMDRLLRCANKLAYPPIGRIRALYDEIIAQGLAFHRGLPAFGKSGRKRRVGHNLLVRLRDKKEDVLRFLTTPGVPFTNNLAERDIRMMKVKQKISGGFRTSKGAEIFATIRGFISTSRKQGVNVFDAITAQLA